VLQDLLAKLKGLLPIAPAATPVSDTRKLDGSNLGTLGAQLRALSPGQRGWISFAEYARLFSADGEGPSEWDAVGLRAAGEFAAQYRCAPKTELGEQRVYFTKNPS
jgi:hypothetical protein